MFKPLCFSTNLLRLTCCISTEIYSWCGKSYFVLMIIFVRCSSIFYWKDLVFVFFERMNAVLDHWSRRSLNRRQDLSVTYKLSLAKVRVKPWFGGPCLVPILFCYHEVKCSSPENRVMLRRTCNVHVCSVILHLITKDRSERVTIHHGRLIISSKINTCAYNTCQKVGLNSVHSLIHSVLWVNVFRLNALNRASC